MHSIVETWHVGLQCKATLDVGVGVVHATGHHAGGVEGVTPLHQCGIALGAFFFPLLGNFIAHTPQHDAGVVAVVHDEVVDVFFPPLVPKTIVAVFYLGVFPAVKTLGHHHQSQAVAQFHLPCRGHVVRGANGVGTHVFHYF